MEADDREVLHGGVANAGAVWRVGREVHRPATHRSSGIHGALAALRRAGFEGAPQPIAVEADRERLVHIPGEVPITPFPRWAQTDDALASIVELLAGLHRASRDLDLRSIDWSDEMADPVGGAVLCHNDVCLENVVFRDGRAVSLLDFDFAAPGRPTWDLAAFARMCVPIDDDLSAERNGWALGDRAVRLRLVCDTYGLDAPQRMEVVDLLAASIERGGRWVQAKVEAGEPGFVAMWAEIGGMERFDRRRRWWAGAGSAIRAAMA